LIHLSPLVSDDCAEFAGFFAFSALNTGRLIDLMFFLQLTVDRSDRTFLGAQGTANTLVIDRKG
jgi:hypothetical protein